MRFGDFDDARERAEQAPPRRVGRDQGLAGVRREPVADLTLGQSMTQMPAANAMDWGGRRLSD